MKILIIGVGSIGLRHIKNLIKLGYKNIAVADTNKKSLQDVLKLVKVPAYEDVPEALRKERPNVVFICTPTNSHVSLIRIALMNDADVFVEKPLAHNISSLDDLVTLAKKRKKVVMIACNYRFHKGFRRLAEVIRGKAFGKPLYYRLALGYYLPTARKNKNYKKIYAAYKTGGGVFLDSGSHVVDYLTALFGIMRITSALKDNTKSLGIKSEDIGYFLTKHQNGITGNIALDYVSRRATHRLEVTTTNGLLTLDLKNDILLYDDGERQKKIYRGDDDINKMFLDELRHFFLCVKKRRRPLQDLSGGGYVVKTILDAL
ncbi:MAG TPA: Gfo/Idh/MocA family oxidoreductase [Candidatus Paceibacterota bacterium]